MRYKVATKSFRWLINDEEMDFELEGWGFIDKLISNKILDGLSPG